MIEALIVKTIEETCERVLTKLLDERLPHDRSEESDWIGPRQVASLLSCHPKTAERKLREWERGGEIPVGRFGGRLRVRRADLMRIMLATPPKPSLDDEAKRILDSLDRGRR